MARYALYIVSFILNHLSYSLACSFGDVIIAIGFLFIGRKKRIAIENLRTVFGEEKTEAEIKKIFRSCFYGFGKGMIELMYSTGHPEIIKEKVVFENKHYLDDALAQGNGVVAVSAHFGNFPLLLLRIAQEGYLTKVIMRSARDQKVEEYFRKFRKRIGLNVIYTHPRRKCVVRSLEALRNNEFLFIPLDQHSGSEGSVFVDFFGKKAATATGPAVFAMRTKAPIVPVFIIRQDNGMHKIVFDKPIAIQEREDEKKTIEATIVKITKVIEKYVRQYPQEWSWMHRRWKK